MLVFCHSPILRSMTWVAGTNGRPKEKLPKINHTFCSHSNPVSSLTGPRPKNDESYDFPRVLDSRKKHNHVVCRLCTSRGKLEEYVAQRNKANLEREESRWVGGLPMTFFRGLALIWFAGGGEERVFSVYKSPGKLCFVCCVEGGLWGSVCVEFVPKAL